MKNYVLLPWAAPLGMLLFSLYTCARQAHVKLSERVSLLVCLSSLFLVIAGFFHQIRCLQEEKKRFGKCSG